ncbi:MAG: molybdopterin-dependent oxidoreductase [Chloroflexota bacterium]|jgi:DMSO/TMAO reductase YedYZ molybdopterin-dependent catalytic subunit
MRQPSSRFGALAGFVTSLPVIALLYLGQQLADVAFVPFDLFDLTARILPGGIITFGIDLIVGLVTGLNLGATDATAKTIEQIMALLIFAITGALFGLIIAWLTRSFAWDSAHQGVGAGLIAGVVAFILVLIAEIALDTTRLSLIGLFWLALILVGWGVLLGRILTPKSVTEVTPEMQDDRRRMLLRLLGGSAGLAIAAYGLGRFLHVPAEEVGAGRPLAVATETATPQSTAVVNRPAVVEAGPTATPTQILTAEATAREEIAPAPGTRPELTSNEDFYRIDINTRPPVLHEDEWELEVQGRFDNPRNLTLEDLMAFPPVTQPITLSCISNRVGGDLIGTSNWTGVRLRDILEDLGIQPSARALVLQAADGFHETVVMNDMLDPRTLLVYGMNGETLPVGHGFPLRIYIPDRYGMKQPKWIVSMTAVAEEVDGYWVKRGWSREARPQIVSVIDAVAVDQLTVEGLVPVGGIAWAGERGITKVELQVDDQPWVEATLRTPPLSPLTWVQWRYDWPASQGRHTIRVRATDGTGALQIEERSGARPDGATGYHERQVTI